VLKNLALVACMIVLVIPTTGLASDKTSGFEGRPVTPACVEEIAASYGIPLPLLLGIMATEGGSVGLLSQNRNGSYDIGPMQINTIWLPEIRSKGISDYAIVFDGCVNVTVGAWILAELLQKHSLWEAVGYYHSRTSHLSKAYANRVYGNISNLDPATVIKRANKGFSHE